MWNDLEAAIGNRALELSNIDAAQEERVLEKESAKKICSPENLPG